MKRISLQILSSAFAFLVLASTVSWTVDKHICMGKVVDIAFFHHAKTCGMMEIMDMDKELEDSCCDDESFTVEGQEDLKVSFFDLEVEQQAFVIGFVYSYFQLFQDFNASHSLFVEHPPPLPDKDYQVLYETFLI